MNFIKTPIAGAWIIEGKPIQDQRGAFSRLFCEQALQSMLDGKRIVQINHSITRGVGAIRGLHYQHTPYAEMKIVRCLKGRVFDVAIDLRQGSATFLKWISLELSPENGRAFIIPEGCAHGFQVLEEDSELLYLHTAFYRPEAEDGVRFNDPKIQVDWPLTPSDVSQRDFNHPYLSEDFTGIMV